MAGGYTDKTRYGTCARTVRCNLNQTPAPFASVRKRR